MTHIALSWQELIPSTEGTIGNTIGSVSQRANRSQVEDLKVSQKRRVTSQVKL